jgi:hypothetical protein
MTTPSEIAQQLLANMPNLEKCTVSKGRGVLTSEGIRQGISVWWSAKDDLNTPRMAHALLPFGADPSEWLPQIQEELDKMTQKA